MPYTCDGCGEQVGRVVYRADGPAAGRSLCRDCGSGAKKMTRLSHLVTFRWRVADVLPPDDPITVPVLRLMMAVDDVRRAQLHYVEATERSDEPAEKHRALGDWLYGLRLLFSHIHEAGDALLQLDGCARDKNGDNRINLLLTGNREALAALRRLRRFFGARDYRDSLIARIRNTIGSHYDRRAVSALVRAELDGDTLLDSTAASVGGLARMADPVVRAIMRRLHGGDLVTDQTVENEATRAIDICGVLITFVDHLFAALVSGRWDAVVERHDSIIDVPPFVARAGEAVNAARKKLQAELRRSADDSTTQAAGASRP